MKKKNPFEKNLPDMGKQVKLLLKDRRMTQTQLAKKAGWHPTTVTNLLRRRNWHAADILLVGNILNYDLIQLLYPAPPPGMVPASTVEELVKEITEMKAEAIACREEMIKLRTENNLMKVLLENMRKGE